MSYYLLNFDSMIKDDYKHKGMRKTLAKELMLKGIKDRLVLKAIESIPRHVFLDEVFTLHAYQDKAFPIGEGQTISQPYTVAIQTQMLEIKKGDKVLEIGTGSGYQACVIMELGAKLYSIERNKVLFNKTKEILDQLGYKPNLFYGDGTKGVPSFAPYDKIIVTAGAPSIPEKLLDQLAISGKLIIPVGIDKNTQEMLLLTKTSAQTITKESIGKFSFVPLIGEFGW